MKYTFDVKMFAGFTVDAANEDEARKLLDERLGYASVVFNGDVNKDGRIGEPDIAPDGEHDLLEIDGEPV